MLVSVNGKSIENSLLKGKSEDGLSEGQFLKLAHTKKYEKSAQGGK